MNYSKYLYAVLAAVVCLAAAPGDAAAQSRGRRGPVVVGRAAPRVYGGRVYDRRVFVSPRILGYAPYRPYYYPYRRGITLGFYAGYGYPYGYPYYGYYPYGYGYPYYGYSSYGYGPYGYPLPPAGYVSMRPGAAYGGVRIQGAPRDAQVFVDGYYVGIVDDFDGPFQHLNLEAGVHRIELQFQGEAPIQFEVNVQPGQTITYHAGITR
jgi:PEGA domain